MTAYHFEYYEPVGSRRLVPVNPYQKPKCNCGWKSRCYDCREFLRMKRWCQKSAVICITPFVFQPVPKEQVDFVWQIDRGRGWEVVSEYFAQSFDNKRLVARVKQKNLWEKNN